MEENKKNDEQLNNEVEADNSKCDEVEVENNTNEEVDLAKQVSELQEELAKMQNMYYKAYADTENLKKRLQNDADNLRKYRIQSFANEILPAIDNLERVMADEIDDDSVKSYVDAVKMIYQQLMNALEKEGVAVIDCLDKPFDPNIHNALVMEKVEGVEPGMVVEEIQKGYMLKDRVLRASLVKVSE